MKTHRKRLVFLISVMKVDEGVEDEEAGISLHKCWELAQ